MSAESDDILYAKNQLAEAHRRLDSVRKRITELKPKPVIGTIDIRTNEVVQGEEEEEIPDEFSAPATFEGNLERIVDIEDDPHNVIIDCQLAIELSVKAMFKAVGQEFDESHDINFKSHNTQNFNREIPDDYPRRDDIIRAIFLTQVWDKFYQIAKYGAPVINVDPSMIIDEDDGERALNDATFCVDVAEDFIDYVDDE
ncbi:HEPN domain-containing protein [Halobium palmae]|uniref:HEPN domain-containing protein n=1 Tax=Halobium palmae TaxID=1776492 RepID=A0ABD5RWT5_9EURY